MLDNPRSRFLSLITLAFGFGALVLTLAAARAPLTSPFVHFADAPMAWGAIAMAIPAMVFAALAFARREGAAPLVGAGLAAFSLLGMPAVAILWALGALAAAVAWRDLILR